MTGRFGNFTGGQFQFGNGNFPGNLNSTLPTSPSASPENSSNNDSNPGIPIDLIVIGSAAVLGVLGVFLATRKQKKRTTSDTPLPPNDTEDSESKVWSDD